MKQIIYVAIIFLLFSCRKKHIYGPIMKMNNENISKSAEMSKKRQEAEEVFIKKWIDKEGLKEEFYRRGIGTWVRFTKNTDIEINKRPNKTIPDTDKLVIYSMQIESFNKDTIYSFNDIGIKEMVFGKVMEIRAIEDIMPLMAQEDEVEILSPSFTAYGFNGNGDKIGVNTPIIIKLKVDKIIKQ